MATRQFADLSAYRRNVNNAQAGANLLDSLIQGVQGGIQLQQLPGKLQENQIAQQLQNAINLQKLQDLQNPQAALARRLEQELTLKAALNPDLGIVRADPGLVGQTIATPGAITPAQQAALTAGATVLPTAPAGLPETPISAFGIQTGLNVNPNIPAQAADDKLSRQIALLNARPVNQTLTREGYVFNPRTAQLEQVFSPADPNSGLQVERRSQVEADAKAKADAAQALSSSKSVEKRELQEDSQKFTSEENEKNRANRITLAEKRSKIASDVPVAATAYQAERQQRIIDSVTDLEQDVGYDTVGFADWFKAVPTTAAKSFASRLKTLKAAIAFGELADMRAASKTGGALGQVSNIELGLLESSLGALDQAQSPSEFKEELGKIKGSIQRFRDAAAKPTAPPGYNLNSDPRALKIKEDLKSGKITRERAKNLINDLK